MHVTHQERAPPTTALLEFAPRRLQPCFFTKVIEAAGQTRERSATVRTARKLSDQPIARIMDAHQFARLRTNPKRLTAALTSLPDAFMEPSRAVPIDAITLRAQVRLTGNSARSGSGLHSPATIIFPIRIEPVRIDERGSTSDPIARTSMNMPRRLPAMVISCTGQAISPFS